MSKKTMIIIGILVFFVLGLLVLFQIPKTKEFIGLEGDNTGETLKQGSMNLHPSG